MKRFLLPTLAALAAFGLWHLAPAPAVQAGPSVDEQIIRSGALPASFADVIEAVQPAVVNISVSGPAPVAPYREQPGLPPGLDGFEDFLRRFFERQSLEDRSGMPVVQGMGSGFIIDEDGYVVTNNHVIQNASHIVVTLNDGTKLEAELVGADPKTDLALLKVESDEPLPYSRFGSSDETRVGDWVIAIGNPFGLGGSATTGIVSARGRDIQSGPFDDFLQIDAPINRGNSGGPLFDVRGRVIGINTAIYSPNGGNIGIGFAIPSEQAKHVIDALRTDGRVDRGWLGVSIQQVDEAIASGLGLEGDEGALVASVVPDSPAASAGLKPGDVIVGIGGEPVERVKELTRKVASVKPGDTVGLDVWRNGERTSLDVEVGRNPEEMKALDGSKAGRDAPKRSALGLSLGELSGAARQQLGIADDVEGALVLDVMPGSAAASKGLRRGDVVVMVGQTPVSDPDEAEKAMAAARDEGRSHVVLRVVRGGESSFVAVPFA